MNYSIDQLSTAADCDFLISEATRTRGDLDNKKYTMTRKRQNSSETSTSIEGELASLNAQITAYEAFAPTLPEGKAKQDIEVQIVNLKHKLFLLNNRRANYGLLSAIQLELEINVIEQSIASTDAYIAAVAAMKASL
jgi:hypothetical protein